MPVRAPLIEVVPKDVAPVTPNVPAIVAFPVLVTPAACSVLENTPVVPIRPPVMVQPVKAHAFEFT